MGRFDGKVALVTGGARGQGRSHAVNFAKEGADVIVLDICQQVHSVEYPMPTREDLDETAGLVSAQGRRVLPFKADVRDFEAVRTAVDSAYREFGRLDFVVANAGIMASGEPSQRIEAWQESLDTMLSGVYYTLKATMGPMVASANGGSMVVTGSTSTAVGIAYNEETLSPGLMGYCAAKVGVLGLIRNFARALGKYAIRVNTVLPMGVNTMMSINPYFEKMLAAAPAGWLENALGVDYLEPQDVSNVILWLCSDEGRYITGSMIPVDSGQLVM